VEFMGQRLFTMQECEYFTRNQKVLVKSVMGYICS
jgi:hypothetical protein